MLRGFANRRRECVGGLAVRQAIVRPWNQAQKGYGGCGQAHANRCALDEFAEIGPTIENRVAGMEGPHLFVRGFKPGAKKVIRFKTALNLREFIRQIIATGNVKVKIDREGQELLFVAISR